LRETGGVKSRQIQGKAIREEILNIVFAPVSRKKVSKKWEKFWSVKQGQEDGGRAIPKRRRHAGIGGLWVKGRKRLVNDNAFSCRKQKEVPVKLRK